MGIRDYLKDWADPNPEGWEIGDKAITNFDMQYSFGKVPAGSIVVIDSLPEARHGADPRASGTVTWGEHKGLEVSISKESALHLTGQEVPCIRRMTADISDLRLGHNPECIDGDCICGKE